MKPSTRRRPFAGYPLSSLDELRRRVGLFNLLYWTTRKENDAMPTQAIETPAAPDNSDNEFLFADAYKAETGLEEADAIGDDDRLRVEDHLRALGYFESEIEKREAESKAYIAREVERAEDLLERTTREARRRAAWHKQSLEVFLRRQPEKVRSEKFVNGTLARRKGRATVTIEDEGKAIDFLRGYGPDLLEEKQKTWTHIDKKRLVDFVRDCEEAAESGLFTLNEATDAYTITVVK